MPPSKVDRSRLRISLTTGAGEALFTARGGFFPPVFLLVAVLPRTLTFVFPAALFELAFFFATGFFVPRGFFFGIQKSLTLAHPANNTPIKIATITPA